MVHVRKHIDIKFVTTEAKRNYLLPGPNYHTTKNFFRKCISHRNEKAKIFMNRPAYLSLSITEISKIKMYEFWYDYVKPKYGEKAKLCYMDNANIKTEDIYSDIAKDVETRFHTSNYQLQDHLKKKKVIGLMKDELSGKIMTGFAALSVKMYIYLANDNGERKAKGKKRCVLKRKLKFEDYKHCFQATQLKKKKEKLEKNNLDVNRLRENHKNS